MNMDDICYENIHMYTFWCLEWHDEVAFFHQKNHAAEGYQHAS